MSLAVTCASASARRIDWGSAALRGLGFFQDQAGRAARGYKAIPQLIEGPGSRVGIWICGECAHRHEAEHGLRVQVLATHHEHARLPTEANVIERTAQGVAGRCARCDESADGAANTISRREVKIERARDRGDDAHRIPALAACRVHLANVMVSQERRASRSAVKARGTIRE